MSVTKYLLYFDSSLQLDWIRVLIVSMRPFS